MFLASPKILPFVQPSIISYILLLFRLSLSWISNW